MKTVTLGVKQSGRAWDGNTHQFVVKEETDTAFIGWTLGNYERDPNAEPCVFPKFAWEVKHDAKRIERNRKARANRKARREALESVGLLRSYRLNGREAWE